MQPSGWRDPPGTRTRPPRRRRELDEPAFGGMLIAASVAFFFSEWRVRRRRPDDDPSKPMPPIDTSMWTIAAVSLSVGVGLLFVKLWSR